MVNIFLLMPFQIISFPVRLGWPRAAWSIETRRESPSSASYINGKSIAVAKDHRSLNDILQPANVAGPIVSSKDVYVFFVIFTILLPAFFRVALDQVFDQQRDAVRPFAERRYLNGENIQSMEDFRGNDRMDDCLMRQHL